jgi:hypothetical protein
MCRTSLFLCAACVTLAATPEALAGYTQYFTWQQPPDEARLKACIKDMSRVVAAAGNLLAGPDETGSPVVQPLSIAFNGRGMEAHEPFVFPGLPGFNFCKTAGKPYDAAVTACLLVARDHFPSATLVIASDGDWNDWSDGAELYQKAFGRPAVSPLAAPVPPGVYLEPPPTVHQTGRKLLFVVAGLAVLIALAWVALRPRYAFIISIEDGVARVSQGRVAAGVLQDMSEICSRCRGGFIRGIRVQDRVRLLFSREIPQDCRQRIQNIWALHK